MEQGNKWYAMHTMMVSICMVFNIMVCLGVKL